MNNRENAPFDALSLAQGRPYEKNRENAHRLLGKHVACHEQASARRACHEQATARRMAFNDSTALGVRSDFE